MLPFRLLVCLALGALGGGLLAVASHATTTTYLLSNHPDGSAAEPFYGLRLDELFDVTDERDIFTFDFEAAGSAMRLQFDDNDTPSMLDDVVRIFGTVRGGLDTGDAYGNPAYEGLWEVEFIYRDNVTASSSGDDVEIEVSAESAANNGSITPLFDVGGDSGANGMPIALVDEQGSFDFSFRFNNTEDHRLDGLSGPEIFTGRGWLNHSGKEHVKNSDWLFTGVIPEPNTAALLGLGLTGLAVAGRRRADR